MTVVPDGADTLLLIPHEGHHEGGGWMRYAAGLFILAWLGGWTAGFASAFSALASGKATAFLVFWLIAWTAGGAMAVSWVYRIFRPSVSESLRLQGGRDCLRLRHRAVLVQLWLPWRRPVPPRRLALDVPQADAAGAGPAHPAVAAAEGDRRRQPPHRGCRRAAPRPRGRGHRGGARVALSAAGEALCPVGAGEGLGEVSDPPGYGIHTSESQAGAILQLRSVTSV